MNTPFRDNYGRVILLIILGFAVFACYLLIRPYLEPVLFAFIVALLFHPIHTWIEVRVGKRANIAALISCGLMTFIILLPMFLMLIAILHQGVIYTTHLYDWVNAGGVDALLSYPGVEGLVSHLRDWLPQEIFDPQKMSQQLMETASGLGRNLVNFGAAIAGNITDFVVGLMLMLFVLFFVLRDYDKIFEFVRHALPLSRSQENVLLAEVLHISKSALLGSFLTAISQGIAGGLALWIVGFPALFWGAMMAFASLIPVVGTALIWLPAALYLMVTGDWGWGMFLILWGVLVVGSIDNFLRPFFMQGSSSMNTVLVFFSLLGGIHAFGLMGLLYGPIILAVTLVLFRLYEQEFREFLEQQDRS